LPVVLRCQMVDGVVVVWGYRRRQRKSAAPHQGDAFAFC